MDIIIAFVVLVEYFKLLIWLISANLAKVFKENANLIIIALAENVLVFAIFIEFGILKYIELA